LGEETGAKLSPAKFKREASGLFQFEKSLAAMAREGFRADVVLAMLKTGLAKKQDFSSADLLNQVVPLLPDIYDVSIQHDAVHDLHYVELARTGAPSLLIDYEAVSTAEYRRCLKEYRDISSYYGQTVEISVKGSAPSPRTPHELLKTIIEAGKEGITIQRYKGLGEMNPEQLWETTMDPENRHMLQVGLNDALEADQIFTILMGDSAESRRTFIEENALDVRNLDI
jgi:DNA gyrase subunit B